MKSLKIAASALFLLLVLVSCESDQVAPAAVQVNAGIAGNAGFETLGAGKDRSLGVEGEVFYNRHEKNSPETGEKPVIGIAKEFASDVQ